MSRHTRWRPVYAPDFATRAAQRPRAGAAVTIPTACPACQSSSITTTARTPDESTYWRCVGCGEIWNAARRRAGPSGGQRWR
jgi:hypothetical protein